MKDVVNQIVLTAENKRDSSFFKWAMQSIFAGMYIGFGMTIALLSYGCLYGTHFEKLAYGATFGIGLLLVIFLQAELFTGNILFFGMLWCTKRKKLRTISQLILCFIFNFIGASILVALLHYSNLINTKFMVRAIFDLVPGKLELTATQLIARGILCNILVCLAVLLSKVTKSDSAKVILVSWCLFVFVAGGFEHSIANMTILQLAAVRGNDNYINMAYNLLYSGIGNVIGGLFIAIPYYLINKDKSAK